MIIHIYWEVAIYLNSLKWHLVECDNIENAKTLLKQIASYVLLFSV